MDIKAKSTEKNSGLEVANAASGLTAREMQIVRLLAQGLIVKEMASQLDISVRTVETHKYHIYRKLGINNQVELMNFAIKNQLVKQ